ncbi:uncharacterized protein LOC122920147 [Bufo gargarizans]|uniref:uncharacterized protein LOC122920147 n=1 Tax=Bufo gargarizans TaxID=30331 RepID=UPI001CF51F87|nr:uncharacterized protein LOC122920147 [Bufo gargarizans]
MERSVLVRGLSFSPMNRLNKFEFIKDIYLFCRQLCFRALYAQPSLVQQLPEDERGVFIDLMDLLKENEGDTGRRLFTPRKPSIITPTLNLFPNIQLFFQVMVVEIRKLQVNTIHKKNLTRAELVAIQNLQNNAAFIIKEADKGDPTTIFKKKFDGLLMSAWQFNIITKKEKEFMEVKFPITPTFYMLPKAFVLGLRSYLRDSVQLVQYLQEIHLPPGTMILTCDVESLYSNISNSDGIQATRYFLQKSTFGDPVHHTFLGLGYHCRFSGYSIES